MRLRRRYSGRSRSTVHDAASARLTEALDATAAFLQSVAQSHSTPPNNPCRHPFATLLRLCLKGGPSGHSSLNFDDKFKGDLRPRKADL